MALLRTLLGADLVLRFPWGLTEAEANVDQNLGCLEGGALDILVSDSDPFVIKVTSHPFFFFEKK